MFGKKMKVYGEDSNYGGYLILKDKKNNKSKHYISAVDPCYSGDRKEISIWVRGKYGDHMIPYKMGSNEKADIAVKTWIKNRKSAGMRVSNDLPAECYRNRK